MISFPLCANDSKHFKELLRWNVENKGQSLTEGYFLLPHFKAEITNQ